MHKSLEALESSAFEISQVNQQNFLELEEKPYLIEMALKEFYRSMNREAMLLKLKSSNFHSAHGMHHD